MKFIDEFRDVELAKKVVSRIKQISTRPTRLMEFCGGHTVFITRSGLPELRKPIYGSFIPHRMRSKSPEITPRNRSFLSASASRPPHRLSLPLFFRQNIKEL